MTEAEFLVPDDEDRPLVPDQCGDADGTFVYDETGSLTMARRVGDVSDTSVSGGRRQWTKPCSLAALDGSWNLSFRPKSGRPFLGSLRGPMRIEANSELMRVSGDQYFQSFFVTAAEGGVISRVHEEAELRPTLRFPWWRRNWYPHYPFDQYRWYFRSTGVSYSDGELFIPFTRHLWDATTEEFTSTDSGWIRLTCARSVVSHHFWPQPTLRITGEAMIGGRLHSATAIKTSPYYRGSVVEVDVMTDRSFPTTAAGQSFSGVFRTAGIDLAVRMSDADVPQDDQLTTSELHNLLTAERDIPNIGHSWYTWLFVGSRRQGSNTFGLMFDQQAPHREGAVGYYDADMGSSTALEPSARNKDLGEVPAAFLRTLIHEAGHAFNLFHPKADVHDPDIGTEIMNQTGDVMGFATADNLYPSNITWGFNDHNRMSLIHSPDPQVAPGWKEFGWGHGSAFGGVPEPADAIGLRPSGGGLGGLELSIELPDEVTRGEFVTARLGLTNTGDGVRRVSRALNLAQGDLAISLTTPSGQEATLRDVVHLCGPRDTAELGSGEQIVAEVQLFYANCGHVFKEPGRYVVRARMTADAATETVVESEACELFVGQPSTRAERRRAELMLDDGVGLSFALGDFGSDETACDKLKRLATSEAGTDTGTAAALVLANSFSQTFRDASTGDVTRRASSKEVSDAMAKAAKSEDSARLATLATAVASPGETQAPMFDEVAKKVKAIRGRARQGEKDAALSVLEDYGAV